MEHLLRRTRLYGDSLCWSLQLRPRKVPSLHTGRLAHVYGASAGALIAAALAVGIPLDLISSECPPRSSETDSAKPACCEPKAEQPAADGESDDSGQQNGEKTHEEEHCWLDPWLTEDLPVDIQKALCEACRETHAAGGLLSRMAEYLPKRVTSYLQIPCALPVKSAFSLAQRLVDWILDVPRDVSRLYSMAGGLYKQAWKDDVTDGDRCTSLPLGLNLSQRKEDLNTLLAHPGAPPPRPPTASGFGDDATDSPQKRW